MDRKTLLVRPNSLKKSVLNTTSMKINFNIFKVGLCKQNQVQLIIRYCNLINVEIP